MSANFVNLLKQYKERSQPPWSDIQESQVLEPYNYLLSNPGKDIRSTLIQAFNVWLQLPTDLLEIVLRAVEMLHTASLLIDDVEDNSDLRRGREAAHLKYGPASTINAANYIYFSAMSLLRSTGNSQVIAIYEEEILNLHRGQGLELYWRDRSDYQACPTEEEYVAMVNDKTGGLLRMAIRLMQALSPVGGHGDYVPLSNLVGILFQIRDDYMNLASLQYCQKKGFCEDLSEGKFSFPVIHGSKGEDGDRLREILLLKTNQISLKCEACAILVKTGSLKYTIKVVQDLDQLCREEVQSLGGNPSLMDILDVLRLSGNGSEIMETVAFVKATQHEA